MSEGIDQALLNCIEDNHLIPHYKSRQMSVALIGEKSKSLKRNTLRYKLKKEYGFKSITVFTKPDKFKVTDGEQFDILIGCRPCEAEEEILRAATNYKKRFILLPCNCGPLPRKIANYVRKYPVIDFVDAYSPQHARDDGYVRRSWMILFNK